MYMYMYMYLNLKQLILLDFDGVSITLSIVVAWDLHVHVVYQFHQSICWVAVTVLFLDWMKSSGTTCTCVHFIWNTKQYGLRVYSYQPHADVFSFWIIQQGSPHLQASLSARYAKIFGRYAVEIADMHFKKNTFCLFVVKTVRSLSQWYRKT